MFEKQFSKKIHRIQSNRIRFLNFIRNQIQRSITFMRELSTIQSYHETQSIFRFVD